MFTMIRNFINDILTWGEQKLAFYQGYTLVDRVNVNLDVDYIKNGKEIEIDII